jgi:hypothetical protein
MRNPFKRSATAVDIRKSFRLLAEKLHPEDKAFGGSETFRRDEFDAEGIGMPKEVATAISGVTLGVTGLLIALAILVSSPLITRSLMFLTGAFANNDGGDRNPSPVGADENPVLAAKHRGPAVPSEPHLVLQQSASYVATDGIPLGIRVDGKADGMALEISDLPSGTTISSGRPLGTGLWRILATDVGNAVIRLPPGFSGTIDLAIELRLSDDTVVDRRSLRLEWPQRLMGTLEPTDTAGAVAASIPEEARPENIVDNGAVAVTTTDQVTALQNAHDPIELLIGRSEKLLSEGQVGAARLLLLPAVEAHDARAALALGSTYDPIMLAIFQAHGVAADVSAALDWYKKASEFGSQKAQQRLNLLTAALRQNKSTSDIAASDNAPYKVVTAPVARPKGRVARALTHEHRPYDRERIDVAGAGAGPAPLLSPPAFIQ